jgi:hypothetical protein
MTDGGNLLRGAIDLHRHGYPEISLSVRAAWDDVDDLRLCRDRGMAGTALKSHMWPTVGRAYLLGKLVPGLRVVPSITLNHCVGGFRPDVVEAAAQMGARILHMPTWSARNDIERGGFSKTLAAAIASAQPDLANGLTVLDGAGKVRGEVRETLAVARAFDMVVFTGHLGVMESLALAASGEAGAKLVFGHADSHSIGATLDEVKAMAGLGSFVEITALGTYPPIARVTHAGLAAVVEAVGPERCVMTTDYFFDWCPPSSTMLLELGDGLIRSGIDESAVRRMVVVNPARLLGLSEAGAATGSAG